MVAQVTTADFDHLVRIVTIVGAALAALNVISFPMMGALYRAWTTRVDRCVTNEVCGAKHQATVDLLEAHLAPINEKLTKLCNGGFVDAVQKRMSEYEHRLTTLETKVDLRANKRKGD